jgi:hypothetical protein
MDDEVDYRKEILIWLTSDVTRMPSKSFNIYGLIAKDYKLPVEDIATEMEKMLRAGFFDFADLKNSTDGTIIGYTINSITEKGREYLRVTGNSNEQQVGEGNK